MTKNMGRLDRGIRMVLGTGFIVGGALLTELIPPLRVFLVLWGGVFWITSSVGY